MGGRARAAAACSGGAARGRGNCLPRALCRTTLGLTLGGVDSWGGLRTSLVPPHRTHTLAPMSGYMYMLCSDLVLIVYMLCFDLVLLSLQTMPHPQLVACYP